MLWRGARRTRNCAGTLFRLAAHGLHRDPSPMGGYLRRMKAKLGPAAATTATAHKIAIIFYTMVKNQVEYDASLWAQRDAMRDEEMVAYLGHCVYALDRPRQSIETLLHAFIPAPHVDHTHPDAVISLACAANGRELCQKLWGERAVWVDYIRPGFTPRAFPQGLSRPIIHG